MNKYDFIHLYQSSQFKIKKKKIEEIAECKKYQKNWTTVLSVYIWAWADAAHSVTQ